MLKQRGLLVHSNDLATYTEVLGRTAIATDRRAVDLEAVAALLDDLTHTPPAPGYFTETFCERSRYIHPDNGARIDAIRARIDDELTTEPLRSIALTALLLGADRVDSTTGLQMAYLKAWAPRALKPLELRVPELLDGTGSVSRLDAAVCAATRGPVDLAYVDPPYNQHSYRGNYHVWETLVRNDRPEVYGVACKRVDCKTTRSPWNSKRLIGAALTELLDAIDARWILMSFNNEGHLSTEEVETALAARGELQRFDVEHTRYVGARIGIHNPAGEKVGTVGHLTNTEGLFLVNTTA
jgi:adenine-specific DNA-methyltransferase